MKIHLISDTHIESGIPSLSETPQADADMCILAGDIGLAIKPKQYFDFLVNMKKKYKYVILIIGNHEFYHMNYIKALHKMKEIADAADVNLLDIYFGTENLNIDGIQFWGSTLWIDFNNDEWIIKFKVGRGLNDFHIIDGFTTNIAYDTHIKTLKKINWNADVIITHHSPILQKHTKYGMNEISYGFCCTDLDKQITDSNVKYWLYGHTHDNQPIEVGNTTVISNQTGYRLERLTLPYDPYFIIEI